MSPRRRQPNRSSDVRTASAPELSRRAVLLGAAGVAGVGLLGACSSSSETSTGTAGSTPGSAAPKATGPSLIAVFDPNALAVVNTPTRLPFAVGDADGVATKDGPNELTFTVVTAGGPIGDPIVVPRHNEGIPIGYYPVRFTPTTTGAHTARTVIDGKELEQTFMVSATSPTDLVLPGQQLRDVATPTFDDPLGTDPICTRQPECPLHDTSLTTALADDAPIALLFSTPAFCQIGVCGPTLDLFIAEQKNHAGTQFIHCEIYKTAPTSGPVSLVDAVESFGLTYEPALYVATADGTVTERLDNVFDASEIRQALGTASA